MIIIVILAGCTQAAIIQSDINNGGQTIQWNNTNGQWQSQNNVLTSTGAGENRIFTSIDTKEITVQFDAQLEKGKGWGLLFGSSLNNNKVTGYAFQYDPGYGSGAYLLRGWNNDRENIIHRVDAALDNNRHNFQFNISENSFVALRNGQEIFSYEGDLQASGDLLGFRTWSNSVAHISNMHINNAVPEPTAILIMLSGLLIMRKKKHGL